MRRPLALITGGTSGIGFAIAQALSKKYDLALVYSQNQERAQKAMSDLYQWARDKKTSENEIESSENNLKASEIRIEIFQQDLRQLSDLPSLYEKIKKHFELAPAILVNAAGRLQDGFVQEASFIEKMSLLQEHLQAAMILSHLSIKSMSSARFGRIINLSSISASFAKRGQANYGAAKSGLEGFTRALALEVAHRGITVNAIAPGLIATPMTENFIAKIEAEEPGNIRKKIPAGRYGQPEEVAALADFLCSQNASYITGTVITIDGGRSLGDPLS